MNVNDDERETRRVHHRAVIRGKELFEVDAADLALDDTTPDLTAGSHRLPDDVDDDGAAEDDDAEVDPLLAELPPHWGVFNQHY